MVVSRGRRWELWPRWRVAGSRQAWVSVACACARSMVDGHVAAWEGAGGRCGASWVLTLLAFRATRAFRVASVRNGVTWRGAGHM